MKRSIGLLALISAFLCMIHGRTAYAGFWDYLKWEGQYSTDSIFKMPNQRKPVDQKTSPVKQTSPVVIQQFSAVDITLPCIDPSPAFSQVYVVSTPIQNLSPSATLTGLPRSSLPYGDLWTFLNNLAKEWGVTVQFVPFQVHDDFVKFTGETGDFSSLPEEVRAARLATGVYVQLALNPIYLTVPKKYFTTGPLKDVGGKMDLIHMPGIPIPSLDYSGEILTPNLRLTTVYRDREKIYLLAQAAFPNDSLKSADGLWLIPDLFWIRPQCGNISGTCKANLFLDDLSQWQTSPQLTLECKDEVGRTIKVKMPPALVASGPFHVPDIGGTAPGEASFSGNQISTYAKFQMDFHPFRETREIRGAAGKVKLKVSEESASDVLYFQIEYSYACPEFAPYQVEFTLN